MRRVCVRVFVCACEEQQLVSRLLFGSILPGPGFLSAPNGLMIKISKEKMLCVISHPTIPPDSHATGMRLSNRGISRREMEAIVGRIEPGLEGSGCGSQKGHLFVLLLLQAADAVDVERHPARLALLLVGGELLLVEGLHADGGVADADDDDAAALAAALLVVLVGEGDVDLGHVIGRVGRRVRVGEHGLAVLAEDEDAAAAAGRRRLDREAAVVAGALAHLVVLRERGDPHLLLPLHALQEHQDGGQDQADEHEREERDHGVDDRVGATVGEGPRRQLAPGRELLE